MPGPDLATHWGPLPSATTLASAVGSYHELAERYLLSLVEFASFGPHPPSREVGSRDEIDAKRRARMEAAAGTFIELGVIDEADAAPFRRRLEASIALRGSDPPIVADDALAKRARELLGRRLAAVGENPDLPRMPATLGRPIESDPAHREAVWRFQELLEACRACRALPEEEISDWRTRLLEVDDGRTWDLERERRQKRCTLADLRTVVRAERNPDGPLQVTSAELYADAVILRWHEARASRPAPRTKDEFAAFNAPQRRHVALTDDLGTEYLHFHTQEAHTGAAVVWTARFATAVPFEARELIAEIRDERFRLLLPGASG